MWLSRSRYEELVRAEARTLAAEDQLAALRRRVLEAEDRAERAVDAMLAVRQLPPLSEAPPPTPEIPMFEDDPEVLAEWKKAPPSPLEALFTEGRGDHDA